MTPAPPRPSRPAAAAPLAAAALCAALGCAAARAEGPPTLTLSPALLVRDAPGTAVAMLPPPADPGPAPVVDPLATDPGAALLRRLAAEGRAAGLAGVIYDNRDRGHSALPPGRFPQLTRLRYAPELRRGGWDYGLARFVVPGAVVIGNASAALTDPYLGRSLPRAAMSGLHPVGDAVWPFLHDALYVHPEHRDHDGNDRFPALWPYTVTSQGSSGSDRPFLDALLLTLAALRPETRARLERERLIAPTLQMLLRASQRGVEGPEDYRRAVAHPSAFDARRLDPVRMMRLGHALVPDAIPPAPVIDVLAEDFRDAAGLAGRSERLFDTPAAVARIWRDLSGRRRIVLSAARTRDPNGRPLRFDWTLLRGRPERVRISPLSVDGAVAEIEIDWHPPEPAAATGARRAARIDVALVVNNGAVDSAPAFLSVLLPHHQRRTYEAGPDGRPRLVEIDYRPRDPGPAFDPLLFWTAPWRDVFERDAAGAPAGWTRIEDDRRTRFDAAGRRAEDGRRLAYRMRRDPDFGPMLQAEPLDGPRAE